MPETTALQDDEPLRTAKELQAKEILKKSTAYRLAKAGIIPSYMVGTGKTGVRFRVSEVLAALRRPVRQVNEPDKEVTVAR
jgi:hypothetical protein